MFKDIFKILSNTEMVGYIFQGFLHTIVITLIAAIIGLLLGFVVAVVKIMPSNKWTRVPKIICETYTTVFRGTPVALQLFIMVFAVFAIPGFKPYAAILTFGINSGAYVSESIRAGITSVDKGQMEAGRALGMNWLQTMIKIILPQAVKNIIPAIGNEFIALLKETSIIGWIGYTPGTVTFDLQAAADTIFKTYPNYLASGILVGCCYLIIVYGFTLLVKYTEKRLKRDER